MRSEMKKMEKIAGHLIGDGGEFIVEDDALGFSSFSLCWSMEIGLFHYSWFIVILFYLFILEFFFYNGSIKVRII